MKILIIGKGYVESRCSEKWDDSVVSEKWIETVKDVEDMLDEYKPDAVLNAAGIVGKPNVDWCEEHQMETIKGNTVLPITIAEACQNKNIYLLHIGSGCIFYGGKGSDEPWEPSDFGNPSAVYTRCKYAADLALSTLPNVGIAKIRMPLDSRPCPQNIIDKLASFPKICNYENSITVIDDMVDVFRQLLEKKGEGIFHVTNPGSVFHKDIIGWYEKYVDSRHTNEWVTEEDLIAEGTLKGKRSANIMQSPNLDKLGIEMPPAREAVENAIKKYAELKRNG